MIKQITATVAIQSFYALIIMIVNQKVGNRLCLWKSHMDEKHDRHSVKSLTLDEEKPKSSSTQAQIIQPTLVIIKDCHINETNARK